MKKPLKLNRSIPKHIITWLIYIDLKLKTIKSLKNVIKKVFYIIHNIKLLIIA